MSNHLPDKKYYIHIPKQQRSLKRYQHILNIAAEMFAKQGYDNVGTNHIADEAGISVGSFYQFFSGKDALRDALTQYYISHLKIALPSYLQQDKPMSVIVREMLIAVFEFERANVAFAQFLSPIHTSQITVASIQMHITLKTWVQGMLGVFHPQLTPDQIDLCASSGMGIVKGMMLMMQPPDNVPFEVVLDEMVHTLMAYVQDFVLRQPLS